MLQPVELSGPEICCPMCLNIGSGGINIFVVKLSFEILTVHEMSNHIYCFVYMIINPCNNFKGGLAELPIK